VRLGELANNNEAQCNQEAKR